MINSILCVDDDPITLMLCKKVIVKAEFSNEILFAHNGQEAIDLFEKLKSDNTLVPPQIIFLDLNMPIVNGWDFLDYITKNNAPCLDNTKVIILSSTIDPADSNKAKQYDIVSHFISKPITVEILQEIKKEYN
jgi:CheY-like chemotaxis protein